MTRHPAVLLAGLLFLARPVAAAEFLPSDYYTAAFTFLGSAGGAVLGASIAGLSRPTSSSSVRPFMQWGTAGAVAGGILGNDLARFSLEQQTDIIGEKKASTHEVNACLGALGGQLAGYGVVAIINDPVSRNSRSLWAGISLGTLAGAAIGYFLPPVSFIKLPPEKSIKERAHMTSASLLEPLLPPEKYSAGFVAKAEGVRTEQLPPARPFLPASKLAKLDTMIMGPENDRIIGSYQPVFPQEGPGTVKPLQGIQENPGKADMAPAVQLAALAGFCLGASAGASFGGNHEVAMARLGVGGALGLLGGWILARTELAPGNGIPEEQLEQKGAFYSMTSALAIAGTVLGIGASTVAWNKSKDFRMAQAGRVTLGAAFGGIYLGIFTTKY